MTFQSAESFLPVAGDAGRAVAHLRHVLELVSQLAGRTTTTDEDAGLDEAARFAAAYADALPVVQRRFDALAPDAAGWAATGVEALLECGTAPHAATRLATELDRAIDDLRAILRL